MRAASLSLVSLTLVGLVTSATAAPVAKDPYAYPVKQGLAYRTGLYAGRIAAGKPVRRPLAVAGVLGRAALVTTGAAAAVAGIEYGGAQLVGHGHAVLGSLLMLTPLFSTTSVFPPIPLGRLMLPMEQLVLGWRAGHAGWRDVTRPPPAVN